MRVPRYRHARLSASSALPARSQLPASRESMNGWLSTDPCAFLAAMPCRALGYALSFGAIFHLLRRENEKAEAMTEEVLALVLARNLPVWLPSANVFRGYLRVTCSARHLPLPRG